VSDPTKREIPAPFGVAMELVRLHDLGWVVQRALRYSLELTGSELGFVGLLTTDCRNLEIAAVSGFSPPDPCFFDRFSTIPVRPSLLGVVIIDRRAKLSNDVAADPNSVGYPAGHPPVKTFLGVPLRLDEEVIGMIGVGNRMSGYTASDEELLIVFADQVAAAIDNARLYERQHEMIESLQHLQNQLRDTERKRVLAMEHARTAERLRQAYEAGVRAQIAVARHLDTSADLTSFFGRLSETIAVLVRARRVAFWRLTPDNRLVVQREAAGISAARSDDTEGQLSPSGTSIPERVVFRDEVYLGKVGDPEFDQFRALFGTVDVRNAVAVSWRSGDTVLGSLTACDSARGFSEEDAWVLRIAARSAGLVWQYKQAEAGLDRTVDLLQRTVVERQRLFKELVTVTERERRQIATDLHDGVLQELTAAELGLQRLHTRELDGDSHTLVESITALVRRTDDHLRRLVSYLSPPSLDLAGGLTSAVRLHLKLLEKETGIRGGLEGETSADVPLQIAQVAFRVVQEALTNVAKHASAKSVVVALHGDVDGLRVCVRNDGPGFDVTRERQPGHIGLATMRERVELTGGRFAVASGIDCGTSVEFWIPWGVGEAME
jgi:signal transduction histidine kinase